MSQDLPRVVMYTKENCPYCVMAKNLLQKKGVKRIEEIRIDLDPQKRDYMIEITGRKTVPQIFIDSYHVGGFDDLSALNSSGELDKKLLIK